MGEKSKGKTHVRNCFDTFILSKGDRFLLKFFDLLTIKENMGYIYEAMDRCKETIRNSLTRMKISTRKFSLSLTKDCNVNSTILCMPHGSLFKHFSMTTLV